MDVGVGEALTTDSAPKRRGLGLARAFPGERPAQEWEGAEGIERSSLALTERVTEEEGTQKRGLALVPSTSTASFRSATSTFPSPQPPSSPAPSIFSTFSRASAYAPSIRSARTARMDEEPSIPLDVQWLLLTTPPPPKKKSTVASGAAARQKQYEEEAGLRAKKAQQERVQAEREVKDGLVKRMWAGRKKGGSGGKKVASVIVDDETDIDPTTMKALDSLDLTSGERRATTITGARTARLDSKSGVDSVPKTWPEYERLYATGDINIEDPPFPPLAGRGITAAFPSGYDSRLAGVTPLTATHFRAPLHLSPMTPIRESLVAKLDLLGERVSATPPSSSYNVPVPPSPFISPPSPFISPPSPLISSPSPFAAPPASPSSPATSSFAASTSASDSFVSALSRTRRSSEASTASSVSGWSRTPTSATTLQHLSKSRSAGLVFPSRTSLTPSPSLLSVPHHPDTLAQSVSSFAMASPATLAGISLQNHPSLVDILARALSPPPPARIPFSPVPKAAVVTLFPSQARSTDAALVVLASVGLPPSAQSIPLAQALCAHALLNGERGLVVMDAERDWRFRGNGLVQDGFDAREPGGGIRFYAAMPIFAPSLPSTASFEEQAGGRIAIGTVALLDDEPRLTRWSAGEKAALRTLAGKITNEIEHFLAERDACSSGRGSVSSSVAPSVQGGASSTLSVSNKPSFDRGSWKGQLGAGTGDFEALSASVGGRDERIDEDEVEVMAEGASPALAGPSGPSAILASACARLAAALHIPLVYLVSLDLSACAPPPSLEGAPSLALLAAHNLPDGASSTTFDPALHLRALRAPEGGLLYKDTSSSSGYGQQANVFGSGLLFPVAEDEDRQKGWVLAGYTTDRDRRWGRQDMVEFERVRAEMREVLGV